MTRRAIVAAGLLGSVALSAAERRVSAQGSAPLRVVDPWARACRVGTTCGAYVTFENPGPTAMRIVGASSPVAARTELHETMLHGGQAHMMAHATATVPARGRLEGKPGKWHVMLLAVRRPLVAGDTVTITFRVQPETGGAPPRELVVRAPVRAP